MNKRSKHLHKLWRRYQIEVKTLHASQLEAHSLRVHKTLEKGDIDFKHTSFTPPHFPTFRQWLKYDVPRAELETIPQREVSPDNTIDIFLSSNRPRGKELNEIIANTLSYARALSSEERYKLFRDSFYKTAQACKVAMIMAEEYRVLRELVSEQTEVKTIPVIPTYTHPIHDKRELIAAERRGKERAKELVVMAKQKAESKKIEDNVNNMLALVAKRILEGRE